MRKRLHTSEYTENSKKSTTTFWLRLKFSGAQAEAIVQALCCAKSMETAPGSLAQGHCAQKMPQERLYRGYKPFSEVLGYHPSLEHFQRLVDAVIPLLEFLTNLCGNIPIALDLCQKF